ncbi:hypothetical protein PybrP1_008701 [[Pythium] brassicae (nom. inval.)]|nr:hypothetical protein PybrP1_008701 [[Pythium] brassicae (nom. inval.)]
MNRLLQRFVGDAASASPSPQQQQQQRAAGGANWPPQAPSYHHPQQQQQQLYDPHQHAGTNSLGLEDIPLSSPVGGSRPPADALFGPPKPPPRAFFAKQREAVADAFFQSEGLAPPSRPPSADVFAQPPRSGASAHSSGFGHFFGESTAASDPFASAPTSSRSGFEVQDEQQTLSTKGSVSDLFASPPRSATPSSDGFEQCQPFQQLHESSALGASNASADLFAHHSPSQTAPSFYDDFAQQQHEHEQPGDNFWATADELFASPDASSSVPTAFQSGFGDEDRAPAAAMPSGFHSSAGDERRPHELSASLALVTSAAAAEDEISTAADLFANPPELTASSHSPGGFDQQHLRSDVVEQSADPSVPPTAVDNASPFATEAEANGFEPTYADPFAQPSQLPASESQETTHGDASIAAIATPADTVASAAPSPTQVNDFFSEAPPSASSLFGTQPSERAFDAAAKPQSPVWQPSPPTAARVSSAGGFFVADSGSEPISEPPAVSLSPTRSKEHSEWDRKEPNPVADNDDDDVDDNVAAVARSLEKTTLDDSAKLVEMYKQMSERLEGEKNELLKVLADQADQFYQMQEYIASLEQELAVYRSHGKRSLQ